MDESPLTLLFDRFEALPRMVLFERMLDAEAIRALSGTCSVAADVPGDRATWWGLELARPLLHPGAFPNRLGPLEAVTGLSTEALEALLFGNEVGDRIGVHVLLERLTAVDAGADPTGGQRLVDHLAYAGIPSTRVVMPVVPLPPTDACSAATVQALDAFLERARRLARMTALGGPTLLVHSEQRFCQAAFTRFYDHFVDDLG